MSINTIKVGDLVFCNGEGLDIFKVESIEGDVAYLSSSLNGVGTGGAENLRSLELVRTSKYASEFAEYLNEGPITVILADGAVQVANIPPGITVEVRNYDVPDDWDEDNTTCKVDKDDERYQVFTFGENAL